MLYVCCTSVVRRMGDGENWMGLAPPQPAGTRSRRRQEVSSPDKVSVSGVGLSDPIMAPQPNNTAASGSQPSASPLPSSAPRVLILDADPLFVEAVTPRLEALGIVVIYPSARWKEGRGRRLPEPDVVLVDADGERDDTVMSLSKEMPNAKRILMAARLDHTGAHAAIQQGFRGAISKDIPLHRFGSAILSVIRGDFVVELESPRRNQLMRGDADIIGVVADSLTSREREILALLVDGASGAEMARRLSLSRHTVRTHVQNVLSKLQVHSRVEAVAYAVRHHIVHPSESRRADRN
jgi:DNA-binding NarL/FixJ family response regulator